MFFASWITLYVYEQGYDEVFQFGRKTIFRHVFKKLVVVREKNLQKKFQYFRKKFQKKFSVVGLVCSYTEVAEASIALCQ